MKNMFKTLFETPDSRYFVKTALKIGFVPVFTTAMMFFSLWLYFEMNYSFFVAKGYSSQTDMKGVLIDQLMVSMIDYLPFVGIFYIATFFMGLILAHLVLRPFDQASMICRDLIEGSLPDTKFDPMSSRKIVVRAAKLFASYLMHHERNSEEKFIIPKSLQEIDGPRTDGVFYIQYGAFIFILTTATAVASYFFIQNFHEAIIESSMRLLRADNSVRTFLISHVPTLEVIVWIISAVSTICYLAIAQSLIESVQGVSYGYLRDIKEIVSGAYGKRLKPRLQDPGKLAARDFNQVLDLYFPRQQIESKVDEKILDFSPPPFIEEFKTKDGDKIFRVVTPDGQVVDGLSYEEMAKFLKQAG
jgi:hypothetical protein